MLLDWIEQRLCPRRRQHSTGYMGDDFLQVKRPNQHYQSTEGTYDNQITEKHNNRTHITKHSKSPSLH